MKQAKDPFAGVRRKAEELVAQMTWKKKLPSVQAGISGIPGPLSVWVCRRNGYRWPERSAQAGSQR